MGRYSSQEVLGEMEYVALWWRIKVMANSKEEFFFVPRKGFKGTSNYLAEFQKTLKLTFKFF